MFERLLQNVLQERLSQFPVVVLTGPRQSGKTTLLETLGDQYAYINLEFPDQLELIKEDPKGVLLRHDKLIIDEAQRFPELMSYIQVIADQRKSNGQFILSGSQNFLLSQQISQSLAGRASILELLPLSFNEYKTDPVMGDLSVWQWVYHGGYPRPYQNKMDIKVWMSSYIQTYVERDVRELLKVKDLALFQRFLRLCAGYHGQILNTNQLAIDTGTSHTTIMSWLSVLEASYIIFKLPPYFNNFKKRLVKSPKLYFYDSGLVCYLLGIDSVEHLQVHSLRGALYEGAVLSAMKKCFLNRGESKQLYYWRDSNGLEVDCLFEKSDRVCPVEIKSTSTFRSSLLKSMSRFSDLAGVAKGDQTLVYTGSESYEHLNANILAWSDIENMF